MDNLYGIAATRKYFSGILLIILTFVTINLAMAANDEASRSTYIHHIYVGEIEGAGKIIMELEEVEKGQYRGRYFYDSKGIDIPLQGTLDNL